MTTSTAPVERLDPRNRAAADAVLAQAFARYPVMRYVLGESTPAPSRLAALVELFTARRWLHEHPVLGLREPGGRLAGVVTLTPPGDHVPLPAFSHYAERVWAGLGADARDRYDALCAVWTELSPSGARWHVNMLGVADAWREHGYGSRLLREVIARAEQDPDAFGIDLTTEDARNLRFYGSHGFQVVANGRIDGGLETWILARDHSPPAAHSTSR
jgi:GNAT superfamily N-acetyltransferase